MFAIHPARSFHLRKKVPNSKRREGKLIKTTIRKVRQWEKKNYHLTAKNIYPGKWTISALRLSHPQLRLKLIVDQNHKNDINREK